MVVERETEFLSYFTPLLLLYFLFIIKVPFLISSKSLWCCGSPSFMRLASSSETKGVGAEVTKTCTRGGRRAPGEKRVL